MSDSYSLTLTKVVNARPQRVFDAWTKPEEIKKWHIPSPKHTTPTADVDLKVGGKYKITMQHTDGSRHTAFGQFTQIDRPNKIAYTWQWQQDDMNIGKTTVTVEFKDHAGKTQIILTHQGFPAQAAADHHTHGWTGILEHYQRGLGD